MSPHITLTTRTLGSYSGVSRVALDLVLALSRCAGTLAVRAWVPHALPSSVDGLALGPCRLLQLPLRDLAVEVLGGEAPPRSLLEHARISVAQRVGAVTLGRSPGTGPAPALEVVNGLGAHALFRRARSWDERQAVPAQRPAPSAIVVHESPRHFERFGVSPGDSPPSAAGRLAIAEMTRQSGRPPPIITRQHGGDPARALGLAPAASFERREEPRGLPLPLLAASRPRLDLSAAIAALRAYDYRVFVSDECRREWNALASLPEPYSLFIPNCAGEQRAASVRARDRNELRRELGYPRDAVQLVCVGAVMARKGQDLVLEALRAAQDPKLRLDFCGPFAGDWAKRLLSDVVNSPLRSRVRFLGAVSDVYERIYAADALVLPSRAEAFPLVVLEAMALGTCVVAAAVDGVTEQIADGQSGLLFPGQNVSALADTLRLLATQPAQRAALGEAGRARYLDRFQRAHQLARWSQAVATMLAPH